jgi:hypothetical protein
MSAEFISNYRVMFLHQLHPASCAHFGGHRGAAHYVLEKQRTEETFRLARTIDLRIGSAGFIDMDGLST